MHARVVRGVGKGVLFREVSSVQECPHRERGSHSLSASSSFMRSHAVSSRAVQSPCWSGTKTQWSSESATFSKNDLKNMDLKNMNPTN